MVLTVEITLRSYDSFLWFFQAGAYGVFRAYMTSQNMTVEDFNYFFGIERAISDGGLPRNFDSNHRFLTAQAGTARSFEPDTGK